MNIKSVITTVQKARHGSVHTKSQLLGRLKQEDLGFKASLGNTKRYSPKKANKNNNQNP